MFGEDTKCVLLVCDCSVLRAPVVLAACSLTIFLLKNHPCDGDVKLVRETFCCFLKELGAIQRGHIIIIEVWVCDCADHLSNLNWNRQDRGNWDLFAK